MLSGHAQRLGAVPAGLVEDHHGVGIGGDLGRDLGQMQVHGRGVDMGQDERGGPLARRAHRGEEVGGRVALVLGLRGRSRRAQHRQRRCSVCRSGRVARPRAGQLALLADPALVLT